MLGLYEDAQQKVRDELDMVLGEPQNEIINAESDSSDVVGKKVITDDITTENMKELKYLDRCIKEALRMFPSIPFVARQMTENLAVGKG